MTERESPFDNPLTEALTAGECPDCELPVTEFLAGPKGGINQNVCCPSCWSAFNIGVFQGGGIISAERIPNDYWRGTPGFQARGRA